MGVGMQRGEMFKGVREIGNQLGGRRRRRIERKRGGGGKGKKRGLKEGEGKTKACWEPIQQE